MNGTGTVFVFLNWEGCFFWGRGVEGAGKQRTCKFGNEHTVADKGCFIFVHIPVKSQILVFEPILSPNLPMKAPPTKLRREHNAC